MFLNVLISFIKTFSSFSTIYCLWRNYSHALQ